MTQAFGPSTLPPSNWRELLEEREARIAGLMEQLELVRQQSGPSEIDVQLSCTCRITGTNSENATPEVDIRCPAHGLAGHLVAYGRRFVQLEKAIFATLGERRDQWEPVEDTALEAVRAMLAIAGTLERVGAPANVGGVEQMIQQRNDALEKADGLEETNGRYMEQLREANRTNNARWEELKQAQKDRHNAESALEDVTATLSEMTGRLAPLTKEVRTLRAANARYAADLAMKLTDDEEAVPDAPDAG